MDDSQTSPDKGRVTISLIEEYIISVSEPSGLALSIDNKSLWTVSDNTGNIYNISLEGSIINEIKYAGDDLEGIAINPKDSTIWVVQERKREIVNVSFNGVEISKHKIDVPIKELNAGLEGICFDNNNSIILVNEDSPMLWIKLNEDYSFNTKLELSISEDLSGIAYDNKRDIFWIVSDNSQLLLQWHPIKGVLDSFNLQIKKAEGVAIDTQNNRIYIISDSSEKLYIFKIDD